MWSIAGALTHGQQDSHNGQQTLTPRDVYVHRVANGQARSNTVMASHFTCRHSTKLLSRSSSGDRDAYAT